ncbi:MAG: hypothetical protein QMD78_00430 [Methanocellales archaeon]|nr:hypothetical protein [Methanocellales archaeon]
MIKWLDEEEWVVLVWVQVAIASVRTVAIKPHMWQGRHALIKLAQNVEVR